MLLWRAFSFDELLGGLQGFQGKLEKDDAAISRRR
jgi:hypothetical protein